MKKEKPKSIHIRMPEEIHSFLRDKAFQEKISLNSIVCRCLENYLIRQKNKYKKELTENNNVVL